jgi:hypothetical protein
MKKLIINCFFCFTIFMNTKAQESCDLIPTTQQLLIILSSKPVSLYHRDFRTDCNITDSVKKRLLYLLHWEWTKEEINEYLRKNIKHNKGFYEIEKRALSVSTNNDSLYKIAYDSIVNVINQSILSSLPKNIDNGIIYTVAFLNLKEAVPILQKGLTAPEYYNHTLVELALARLGNKELQTKIINNCIYNKNLNNIEWVDDYKRKIARKLIFVSSQESIYKLEQWLDTSKVYTLIPDRKPDGKSAYVVLADLKHIILNIDFQELLKEFNGDPRRKMDNTLILVCKEWLIKNKGKYEINKNYCPY